MIEKVDRRLEDQAGLLLRGQEWLLLLGSMLFVIPMFYLSIFKLPVGVGKQLEGLMRRFLWKGSKLGNGEGMVPVSRNVTCRLVNFGGLGVLCYNPIRPKMGDLGLAQQAA